MDMPVDMIEITVFVVDKYEEHTGEATIAVPRTGFEWDVVFYMVGRESARFMQSIRTEGRGDPAVMMEYFSYASGSPFDGRKPWEEQGRDREKFPLLSWYQSTPCSGGK